jgi:hypothetical protein
MKKKPSEEELKKLVNLAHKSITKSKGKEYAPNVHEIQKWIEKHLSKENKIEVKETDSGSSGSFEGGNALSGGNTIKRKINKIHNFPETDINEITAGDPGSYDVPFGDGSKNPLKVNGPNSVMQSRAVKDKNFPKWGGPGGVYVKVKEKCKKFPYCNQGNTGSIEFYEVEGLKESVQEVSKKYGIPYSEMEKVVINEIKKIFI